MGTKFLVIALMLTLLISSNVWADEATLSQRIERLERIMNGQGLMSLFSSVQQLQNEVQHLNGDNESLRHELEVIQRRQRELYLDVTRRLQTELKVVPAPTVVPATSVQSPPETTVTNKVTPAIEQPSLKKATREIKTPSIASKNGEAAYQSALQTLRNGQYEQALEALTAFPKKYSESSYLPNAYYWQGEANYVLRHFELAITAFQTVIDRFPASRKVVEATLKLGFSQYELGQTVKAKATLSNLIEKYPKSSAARLASVRLDRIKQETR